MSLDIVEKKNPVLKSKDTSHLDDEIVEYAKIIVPYSAFFHKIELLDVYSGVEDIPFEERAPEYKNILLNEFL